jgi:hypothetical protein
MRKGKNDSNNYPIIKNIQLISPEDQFYKLYCTRFKTEKKSQIVQTANSTNKTAGLASHALEDTVFEWIKKSGISLENRIIYFEKHFRKDKFVRLFKELDYVLKKGDKLIIGELKVSNHNPTGKALKQTFESRELLKKIYTNIEVQIVWIDLSPIYSQEKTSEFNPEFLKTQFADLDCTDDRFKYKQKIKLLHIDAQDIFNWGVENKLIRTPEIILASIEEAEFICNITQSKDNIRKLQKSNIENIVIPDVQSQINVLEKNILVYKARLDLFQKGWSVINQNIKSDLFKLLENETIFFLKTNQHSEFKTENQKSKFIIFQKPFQSEVHLLHAGKIYFYYHRVSLKEISEIENIFIHFENDTYPIVNNKGRRKFCFDYSRIDITQKNNSSIQEFKRIIDNAEPLKILLNDDEFLIIDNHVMLYRI